MKRFLCAIVLVSSLAGLPLHALILTGTGNTPMTGQAWPAGAVTVANLPSRISWWEGPPLGGGESHFEFVGDTAAFQEALDTFSKIRAPVLDLFIHDGEQRSFVHNPNRTNSTINWTFIIWNTNSWAQMYGQGKAILFSDDPNAGKTMPPPRLDLFLGSGRVALDQLKLPGNVTRHDERAVAAGVDTRAGSVLIATIKDARTAQPIPGSHFVVASRDTGSRHTNAANAQGLARMEGLPAGGFQLSAAAEGYVEVAVAYGDYPAHTYKKFEVALAHSGSVSGRVLDTNGNAVPNIRVSAVNTLLASNVPYRTLSKGDALSDSAGAFTLTELPVGLVQLWIRSTNYFQTNAFDYHPVPGTNVPIIVSATGSLFVQVRDSAGRPAGEWQKRPLQISVEPTAGSRRGSWGGSASLRPDGTYLFTSVHPGAYSVKLLNTPSAATVLVQPNQLAEVTLQLP